MTQRPNGSKRGIAVRRTFAAWLVLILAAIPCFAHVGSPDVYFQGAAGPYHLIVTIRTPQMIPGVANVEVLSSTPGITKISVVPTYIVGLGAKYPPVGDVLSQANEDPQYFSGKIWLMESGSWQVRLKVEGAQGPGELAVPVPAFARRTLPMERSMGILLFALMALLVVAFISILGAARREGTLPAGAPTPEKNRRSARIVMGATTAVVLAVLFFGNQWWDSEAVAKARNMIYEAPSMDVTVDPGGKMRLETANSLWHSRRPETVMTKLVPDHGHLMHLFLLREPGLDAFYHLHPTMVPTPASKVADVSATFEIPLPAVAPGKYQVYADVVRESGFPDTMTAEIELPATTSAALTGDDSAAITSAVGTSAAPGFLAEDGADGPVFTLPDGYKMAWVRGTAPLVANQFTWLRFRLEDASGKPVTDAEPYMGMAGHAEIVSDDRSVFAHIHPDGSVAMAALEMTQPAANATADAGMDPNMKMPMDVMTGKPFAEVSFPYGFPKAGKYRMFVQIKRGGVVETGVFDVEVAAAR
jgi:hypothetical protein